MKQLSIQATLWGFVFLAGCGPMTAPMVHRLDKEAQKTVDEGWEKALAPIGRLDRHVLLEIFVGTGAYQRGVDKLYCRSEKSFSGGVVVMEIHFDRAFPSDDRFEVKVLGKDGQLLRNERYGRDEVETTFRELFDRIQRPTEDEKEATEQAEKRARCEARWAKIEEFFPKSNEASK